MEANRARVSNSFSLGAASVHALAVLSSHVNFVNCEIITAQRYPALLCEALLWALGMGL